MFVQESWDCLQMLLDVICYEIHGQHLSPEMTALIEDHLKSCHQCRKGVGHFQALVQPEFAQKNFG